MIGALAGSMDIRLAAREAFGAALATFVPDRPVAVIGHFDADGLSAAAILARALTAAGHDARVRIVGKAETPWDDAIRREIADMDPGGVIVTDLGTRPEPVLADRPQVTIDHHRPTGTPPGTTISGNGAEPEPTSALLAWWAAAALGDQGDLLWLAALGLIGDMAEECGFPELTEAQLRWGKTALRHATSLVNAPRRTAAADASPALGLLMDGDGPRIVTKSDRPERQALLDAKAEVRVALDDAKRVAPQVVGEVAMIRFHSGCQIHPLIAQQWRGRLKDKIVLAANTGYRPGWVHFAARSATGRDLIAYLAEHRPPGADGRYGNGHAQATGGALRAADWNHFVRSVGLPDQQVTE